MKTSELSGQALNWAVATALGRAPVLDMESHGLTWQGWWLSLGGEYVRMPNYCGDGDLLLRLLNQEGISLWSNGTEPWDASLHSGRYVESGPTPAIAAWRCFVASKLGDEVDVPGELT